MPATGAEQPFSRHTLNAEEDAICVPQCDIFGYAIKLNRTTLRDLQCFLCRVKGAEHSQVTGATNVMWQNMLFAAFVKMINIFLRKLPDPEPIASASQHGSSDPMLYSDFRVNYNIPFRRT